MKNKKIIIALGIILILVIITILSVCFSGNKPKQYNKKIEKVAEALSSEKNMEKLLDEKIIDLKGVAAWKECEKDEENFEAKYKEFENNSDEVEEARKKFMDIAKKSKEGEIKYKIYEIDEIEKSENNKKIYRGETTIKIGSKKYDANVIFYKGKIIDIEIEKEKDTVAIIDLDIDTIIISAKSNVSKMGQQEKELYNAAVKRYIGDSKKGTDVKLMIEDIITINNQNVNDIGKFISIHNGNENGKKKVETFERSEKLDKACAKANIYENVSADNNQDAIDDTTEEMRKFAKKISSGRNYKVEAKYQDGVIYAVYISSIN